ncbi:hypothetical protein [Kitasatospora sp. NPDC094011]|uniref:hypothetical protein n=1 Tax=Kitasatospora sp. NPDC094011 TaxID=3364090 RepID=UPI00381E181F
MRVRSSPGRLPGQFGGLGGALGEHLTPEELTAVGEAVRQLLARYRDRDDDPAARPAGTRPVAAVARLFPLLDE